MATRSRPVVLILAATNPALGIGKNGTLPWRLKREMKFFKQVTDGAVVVMGRKTWDSIPPRFRPLSNRKNIVISRNPAAEYGEGVIAATSFEEALQKSETVNTTRPTFVIGGADLYRASLPHADQILLTLIDDHERAIECDTFFEFDRADWEKTSEQRLLEAYGANGVLEEVKQTENGLDYEFTLWERAVRT